MVNWDRVERLRSKGMDWDSIVADPKVNYTAPEGVEDSGRALKALYYSRKSKNKVRKGKADTEGEGTGRRLKRLLVPVGLMIAVAGGIWTLFAFESSLISVFLPAFPDVLLIAAAGAVLLGVGLILGTSSLAEVWKKPLAAGIALGLGISGVLALIAVGTGIPVLHPLNVSEPGNWGSENPRNAAWTSGGLPVVFYYGSIACPYCSAGSWAFVRALSQFGTWSGLGYAYSSPTDVYPNTPEVDLTQASFSSNYLSVDIKEGNNDQNTGAGMPSISFVEQDYLNEYDSQGSIPFYVVGGFFVYLGGPVAPSLLSGMTTTEVQNLLSNPPSNGSNAFNTIQQVAWTMEAFFVKADQLVGITPPSGVTANANVMTIVANIR